MATAKGSMAAHTLSLAALNKYLPASPRHAILTLPAQPVITSSRDLADWYNVSAYYVYIPTYTVYICIYRSNLFANLLDYRSEIEKKTRLLNLLCICCVCVCFSHEDPFCN